MNVSVPSEFVPFIDQLVTGGDYPTADAVVGDALALMRRSADPIGGAKAISPRSQRGDFGGECEPFDVEEILAAGRRALASKAS